MKLFKIMLACAVCAGLFVVSSRPVPAQTGQAAVESYVGAGNQQEIPEGIMPDGVEWNHPLKAGQLTLQKTTKPKTAKPATVNAPSAAAGGLKAPRMQSKVGPPLLSSGDSSTASMMLMQGMKNALSKAGHNTEVPKSKTVPTAASDLNTVPATETSSDQTETDKKTVKAPEPEKGEIAVDLTEDEFTYEPGQEPKSLLFGKQESKKTKKTDKDEIDDIDAEFEDAPVAQVEDAPKATELEESPISLSQASSRTAKSAQKTKAQKSTSIFGDPVDEPEEASVKKPSKCSPSVASWTKECSEAGYPTHYTGKITGETRVECPDGIPQDVWLSNTCASPSGEKDAASSEENKQSKNTSKAEDEPEEDVRIDGSCGKSNGLASEGKPAADLCRHGISTEVTGEGPWRWSCKGKNGGMTVSCAAPVAKKTDKSKDESKSAQGEKSSVLPPEDGKCGSADGTGTDAAPIDNLCAQGIPSRVNGGGPWTWACSGLRGGQAVACTAPKRTDGVCGEADNRSSETMPTRDLCSAGYASAVTGEGPWNWTCSGLYGGNAVTCSASQSINGVCGSASMTGHREEPKNNLCSAGEAGSVSGSGPWAWTCSGSHGGSDVKCAAPAMIDGKCGEANGNVFETAPENKLCETGTPSRVTGVGPWDWNCAGFDGGETVSCTATLGKKENKQSTLACGPAAESAAFQAPTQNLCLNGKSSAVGGDGPWTWSCSDDDGNTVACSTLSAVEGACGKAANVPIAVPPTADLCASGVPETVRQSDNKTAWVWECKGSMGAATVSCSSPVDMGVIEPVSAAGPKKAAAKAAGAACGSANGQAFSEAPMTELCESGKPSIVRGKGPWVWTCSAKKEKVTCEAYPLINATCGSANGSIQRFSPTTGLCAAGTPTQIEGSGPWMWSCIGSGGGTSVSCSASSEAQTRVDGACGAAGNAVMTSAPEENLCDSGKASQVYGEGPWTWTCSGMNGGIAVTCKTVRVLPKAPAPPGPEVNGNCGPANGVATVVQPIDGLCSTGQTTDISGNGPWNWNCLGENGGMTVSCTAPLMPPAPIAGVCGPANGITTMTQPRSGLCSAGIASAVSGNGPWTWSCSGTNGGGAVSCVAPMAGKSDRPLPSTTSSFGGATLKSPTMSNSLVTPNLPSGPLPPLETGTMPPSDPVAPMLKADSWPSEPSYSADTTSTASKEAVKQKSAVKVAEKAAEPIASSTKGRLRLPSGLSSIEFDRGSDQIDEDGEEIIQKLAIQLMLHAKERITLVAYAEIKDTTPRDARRLSLSRALAVRDELVSKGVTSDRIDVRALGANVPSGDMDRVDVKVN